MQCQYRSYAELVGFLQKKKNSSQELLCHSTPFKTFMLTICSTLNINGNFT